MARPRPKNPQALAAVITALRALAEDRTGDDFERTASQQLAAGNVDKDVARQMVARFDRLNAARRERALGEFGNQPVDGAAGGGIATTDAVAGTRTIESVTANVTGHAADVLGGSAAPEATTVTDGHHDGPRVDTYGINYVGFFCDAETTYDAFTNSDEVFAVTSVVSINENGFNNTPRVENHPYDQTAYTDVDDGEVRLGPVARCWEGSMPDGQVISLTVIAWEHDYGDPNKYRAEIDVLVKAAILAIGYLTGAGTAATAVLEALSSTVTDAVNWLIDTDDDQIDIARTVILTREKMEEIGRRPLVPYYRPDGTQTELITSDLIRTHHSGSGAKYIFGFVLDRDPKFEVEHIIV